MVADTVPACVALKSVSYWGVLMPTTKSHTVLDQVCTVPVTGALTLEARRSTAA